MLINFYPPPIPGLVRDAAPEKPADYLRLLEFDSYENELPLLAKELTVPVVPHSTAVVRMESVPAC